MIEFVVSSVSCLICVVVLVLVFMKVQDISNLNSGYHSGLETMAWLEQNPTASVDQVAQKAKQLESNNRDSKPVLKMSQDEFDSMIATYHQSREERARGLGSEFLVIVTNSQKVIGVDYVYSIMPTFPYTKYLV